MWKQIPGWQDYEVNEEGQVRRSPHAERKQGATPGKILKQFPGPYMTVTFYVDRIAHTQGVHCLVATAFLGPRPSGMEPNHKDGNKHNNRADNLEYLTRSENMKHAIRLGLLIPGPGFKIGENHPRSVLDDNRVREIKKLLGEGCSKSKIAEKFKISRSCVSHIKAGRVWTHVE